MGFFGRLIIIKINSCYEGFSPQGGIFIIVMYRHPCLLLLPCLMLRDSGKDHMM